MILTTTFNLFANAFINLIELLPTLPNIPNQIMRDINGVINLIFDNVGLFGLFIPLNTIKLLVPIFITGWTFFHLYDLIMWVIEKIPMLNIDK